MKTVLTLLCLLALTAMVGSVSAEEKKATTKKAQPQVAAKPAAKPERRVTTGSYIPSPTNVRGQIADTTSHVVVLDSEFIQRSGARDLADLLRRGGWNR
jgi:hypothetical protein